MKLKALTGKKRMRFILHLVAWMIVFAFPLYWLTQQTNPGNDHFGRFYAQSVAYLLLFYVSFFWLVPKFWLTGKKWMFLLLTVLVMSTIYATVNIADNRYFKPPQEMVEREIQMSQEHPGRPGPEKFRKRFFLMNYLFSSILISGFCVGLRVSEKLEENEIKRKELEKEKLNSELAFLKNQISPHFFFNTLNNIYSLITINQTDAQDSVLKLSKLMRYLLYESEQGTTTLGQEVSFMKNYIDLMRLRVTDKVKLDSVFPENHSDLAIPPLVFIPFIENAFKHGISYQHPSYINVSLQIQGNDLIFNCENSIGRITSEGIKADSGIGLENVTKRLQLLYPDRHVLTIRREEERYVVYLKINTSTSHS